MAAEVADRVAHDAGILVQVGRRLVGVDDTEPAAEIEMINRHPRRTQGQGHFAQAAIGALKRLQLGDLRADMQRHAAGVNAGHVGGGGEEGGCRGDIDAEFVFLPPGGDFFMGAGVDIGIHAEADRRHPAHFAGDGVEHGQFGETLDVELANPRLQCESHLGGGFGDPGEDNAPGRHTGG